MLAIEVGLPSGSIAKMLAYEFGTKRKPEGVRDALRTYFDWKGTPRGKPECIRRQAA